MGENTEKNLTTDTVQEGEVITDDTEVGKDTASQTIIDSLQGLIRDNLAKEKKLREEAGKYKEMIDSALLNDPTYKEHEEAAKQAAKVKNSTKLEILKRPENSKINQNMKDINTEIKEIKESMASYLAEYQRLTGSTEIEDDTGETMQIIYTAKLVRRRP